MWSILTQPRNRSESLAWKEKRSPSRDDWMSRRGPEEHREWVSQAEAEAEAEEEVELKLQEQSQRSIL